MGWLTLSASLRAVGNSPQGMYVTCSPDTPFRWHGVFFVHRGKHIRSH